MNKYSTFVKIVEIGSFTKAAHSLGYTQSGISQIVKSLEHELSTQLLFRSKSGIKLTPNGQRLLPYIEQAGKSQENLWNFNSELLNLSVGTITIAAIASVSSHILPKIIKAFTEQYPNIGIFILQGDYSEIKSWVMSGRADFGFINPIYAPELESEPLFSVRMRAVMPSDHPLATQSCVTLEQLQQEPYIMLEEGAPGEPLQAFEENNLRLNTKLRLQDDYTIMSMVEQGLGVSILSELIIANTSYNIVSRATIPAIFQTIAVVYLDAQTLSYATRTFISFLRERVDTKGTCHV